MPRHRSLAAAVLCLLGAMTTPAALAEAAYEFNLPAQSLADALRAIGRQTTMNILFEPGTVENMTAPALRGRLSATEAVQRLLAGTKLAAEQTAVNSLLIRPVSQQATSSTSALLPLSAQETVASEATKEQSPGWFGRLRLAQNDQTSRTGSARSKGQTPESSIESSQERIELEEIVVTGSHIRGAAPVGVQLITIDRAQIDRSGFATVHEVVRTLPQIFGGGVSEDTLGTGLEAGTNGAKSTALNLRGLGSAATLVLINGRRMPAAGTEGGFTDISSIPLSAVERIEVLPDSASAIYGADAVGGVVNVILRNRFEGAETSARFGSVTEGGLNEYQVSQAVGGHSATGISGMLSYEFYKRDALPSSERALVANSDLRPRGGSNWSFPYSNPATLSAGGQIWAIPAGQDGTQLQTTDLLAGTANLGNTREGADLLPDQRRHSAFGTARYEISPRLAIAAEGLLTKRDVSVRSGGDLVDLSVSNINPFYINPAGGTDPVTVLYSFIDDFGPRIVDIEVESSNTMLAAELDAGGGWTASIQAAYALEEVSQRTATINNAALAAALADPDPATAFNPFGDGSFTNAATLERLRNTFLFTTESDLKTFGVLAQGPALRLVNGDVRLAVGAEHRRPSFGSRNRDVGGGLFDTTRHFDRKIDAAFVELLVPLTRRSAESRGFGSIDLSLAGRYENYSDFGDAITPKIGLTWSPTASFSLRGAWSESFKAPNLADLDEEGNSASFVSFTADPSSPTGFSPFLWWAGKNADLTEESASIWSFGVDLTHPSSPQQRLSLTYFNILFQDRIEVPQPNSFSLLTDPTIADLVTLNPTQAQRQEVCSRSTTFFGDPADCLNAPIVAILDARVQNTAVSEASGIDLIGSYGWPTTRGRLQVDLNATYLLQFDRAQLRNSPVLDLLDTATNPVDLRVRGGLLWIAGPWSVSGFLNYTDGYTDTVSQPNRAVGSWTTLDGQFAYRMGDEVSHWLADSTVTLTVQNLFDRDPPFFDNPFGIGYDAENADLLGRFVSLQVRKVW